MSSEAAVLELCSDPESVTIREQSGVADSRHSAWGSGVGHSEGSASSRATDFRMVSQGIRYEMGTCCSVVAAKRESSAPEQGVGSTGSAATPD